MPDISIIIVNYNTIDLVMECIKSIKKETAKISCEIIIVDNNSANKLEVVNYEFPEVKLIKLDDNKGFGIANNIGIEKSKGRYILLLNSDTIILDRAIEKTFDFMESEFAIKRNIGLAGCKLITPNNTIQHSVFGKSGSAWRYFLNSNPILSKFCKSYHNDFDYKSDSPQLVSGGVSGAFMFFRKEVFDHIKPFDPDIFMYAEETELCRNRIIARYNIAYFPGAKVLHLGGASSPGVLMYYQNMLSSAIFWYKKGNLIYISFCLISFINFLTYLLIYPMVSQNSKKLFKKNIRGFIKIFSYLLFDIPKYKRSWGARPDSLKLRELFKND